MWVKVNINNLSRLRAERNFSQHRLSTQAGLGGNAVYRLENCCNISNKTSILRLKAIADVLKVDLDELIVKERSNNGFQEAQNVDNSTTNS